MFGLPDIFHSAMCTEYRLTTLKDMTPEQADIAVRDAELWAKEKLSTLTYCNRCGRPYQHPNPACINAKIHDQKENK